MVGVFTSSFQFREWSRGLGAIHTYKMVLLGCTHGITQDSTRSHGIIWHHTMSHYITWHNKASNGATCRHMGHVTCIVLCHKILSVASQSSYDVTQTDNTSHSIALHRIASHGPRLRLWRICRFTPDESYFCSGQKKTFWHCLKLFSRWPLLKTRPQRKEECESLRVSNDFMILAELVYLSVSQKNQNHRQKLGWWRWEKQLLCIVLKHSRQDFGSFLRVEQSIGK